MALLGLLLGVESYQTALGFGGVNGFKGHWPGEHCVGCPQLEITRFPVHGKSELPCRRKEDHKGTYRQPDLLPSIVT